MRINGVSVEQQRLEMVTAVDRGASVAQICATYGLSRETFYKWRRRWLAEGLEGLADRSSRPRDPAGMCDPGLESEVVALREANPRWGSRRLAAELRRSGVDPPARSTIDAILRRNGLMGAALTPKVSAAVIRFERANANELWQMDGVEVALADGSICEVVTCIDDHSRLCPGLWASATPLTSQLLITAFDKAAANGYGLPYSVLSDNGTEFTGRHHHAVGPFERHLWQQGIATLNGRPYHPQTQGKVERFHRTLREWLADRQKRHGPISDVDHLNAVLELFRVDYNTNRPHQAFDDDRLPQEAFDAAVKAGPDPQASALLRQRTTMRQVTAEGQVAYACWGIGVGREWAHSTLVITDYGSHIDIAQQDGTPIRTLKPDYTRRYLGTGKPPGRRPKH